MKLLYGGSSNSGPCTEIVLPLSHWCNNIYTQQPNILNISLFDIFIKTTAKRSAQCLKESDELKHNHVEQGIF